MKKETVTPPKRSQQKRYTLECKILRFMRHSKKLSVTEAGALVGISGSAIAHIEHGRMDISRARVETLTRVYGYTMDDFLEYAEGKEIPINHRDECITMLSEIDEVKIRAVYSVLIGFLPAVGSSRRFYE